MQELKVKIAAQKESEYPIIIGYDILKNSYDYIKKVTNAKKFLIVTNETIFSIYNCAISLPQAEYLVLPDGEEYKNIEVLQEITDKALEMKLERNDAIVTFGGGVIGDMAGFAASIYQRGLDFIQIPTTLLAQVDSSVGGKVAVNHPLGKNMLGAFYQPKIVLADTKILETLDDRQLKTGLGEVVKYAFIEKTCGANVDYNLFEYLENNAQKILMRDKDILREIIKISCSLKASVVNQDEKEKGLRAILNLGHTFAHAFEKVTDYKIYTHGEAVAKGVELSLFTALEKDLISDNYFVRGMNLIKQFDFQFDKSVVFNPDELIEAMSLDKKVDGGKLRFVLPVKEKEVQIFNDIDTKTLYSVFSKAL
ncbi:MAG: 3-dehydroquinate synthase [Candidatus Gastranaerophilales bacterium]|nr:3-dehydroquinate synthase [Candidatus Gastranaerophilales bacterium]